MNIVIRRAVAADSGALAELAARTFYDTFSADSRPEDMASHLASAYGPEIQRQEITDPDITTLLVEIDGQLAGYAQLRSGDTPSCVEEEPAVELWRFYIAKGWHGRGVAQPLMGRVEEETSRRGARALWLGVWERNDRAQAFYRKHGFRDVGSHIYMVGTDAQTDRIFVRSMAQ